MTLMQATSRHFTKRLRGSMVRPQTVLRYFSPVSTPPLRSALGQLARGCQNRMNGRRYVYFQSGDCGRLKKLFGNKPFKSNSPRPTRAAFDLFRTELKPSRPFRLVSRLLRSSRAFRSLAKLVVASHTPCWVKL